MREYPLWGNTLTMVPAPRKAKHPLSPPKSWEDPQVPTWKGGSSAAVAVASTLDETGKTIKDPIIPVEDLSTVAPGSRCSTGSEMLPSEPLSTAPAAGSNMQEGIVRLDDEEVIAMADDTPLAHEVLYECSVCKERKPCNKTKDSIINAGSKRYPLWRCKCCHAAAARLTAAAVTDAEKKELKALKRNTALFHLKIMELKSDHIKNQTQKAKCRELLDELVAESSMTRRRPTLELDEPGYIAYQKFQRNRTEEQATQMWKDAINDKDQKKTVIDGVQHVIVKGYTAYMHDTKKSIRRHEVVDKDVVQSLEDRRRARKRVGAVASISQSTFFQGVGGEHFEDSEPPVNVCWVSSWDAVLDRHCLCQGFAMILAGYCQDFVRTHVRTLSGFWPGFCQDSVRILSGRCQDGCQDFVRIPVRILSGLCQDSVRILAGLCQDSVRILSGPCQDYCRGSVITDDWGHWRRTCPGVVYIPALVTHDQL